MAAASVTSQVVTKVIESVQFTFYTDNEVRASSVKSITSPILFDNMNRPAPEGLYDPALGPVDHYGSCITCGESAMHCPGHCGHIELVLPVYNPLIKKYAEKLELIISGEVVQAKSLDTMVPDEESSMQCPIADMRRKSQPSWQCEKHPWTSLQLTEAKEVLNMMMSDMKSKKCNNCGAKVPTVKSPIFGRLYQAALTRNDITANIVKGLKLDLASLFGGQSQASDKTARGDNPEKLYPSSGLPEHQTMIDDVIDPSEAEQSDTTSKKSKKPKTDVDFGSLKDEEMCSKERFLTPLEVKEHLRLLWEKESHICSLIWDIQQEKIRSWGKSASHSMFFLQALLVTPSKFRPPNKMNNVLLEHPQNILYSKVLQANIALAEVIKAENIGSESLSVLQATNKWINLQDSVNILIDSSTSNSIKGKDNTGVRQLLEKKEGLFRQNMMGKRVNFACRSVISPDPYIAVNEIGIPPYFAERLTYPEKVTHWNVEKLRQAVRNGPSVYPGATHFEDEQGTVNLSSILQYQRNSIAKKLLSTPGAASSGGSGQNIESAKVEGKIVYRHLQDGDILLVNRQPTLHKPSMMAHVARVLKGEKTIRMHYANCSTYNADFDGDEMNVHFPQDEIARAEAYNIVNANEQYIVPTSGDPIRGLIQDHIVSAALLTKKDTFLTKEDYQHLVYTACVSTTAPVFQRGKSFPKVGIVKDDHTFLSLPPAILKPEPLWTGKQVITTVLHYVTKGSVPFTMKRAGKVPGDYWGKNSGELKVRIQNNELICGVIDKAQFGKHGLVHIVQELYGADVAGHLLSVFSRLFTGYLQMHGFTCGVADLLLVPQAEDDRQKKLEKSEELGDNVHFQFIGANGDQIGVNFTQISSLLGQQELEGKRVPRMISGKTLPCFLPWDSRARAGGFISDRFLTGLRPQEYYFHCMAGRDGEDAERLAAKLRRIRFADLVESLNVGVIPFSVKTGQVQTVYKLKMKLFPQTSYPPYSDLTLEDCENVFRQKFIPVLTKDIGRALKKARKGGRDAIEIISESLLEEGPIEMSEDETQGNPKSAEQTEDEDEREEEAEDEGADAQKRKAQGTDEMDYDDEVDENELSMVENLCNEEMPLEEEGNDDNCSDVHNEAGEDEDIENEESAIANNTQKASSSAGKKTKSTEAVEASRIITKGSSFEVQFAVAKSTHILLAQIAENVAKKVFVRSVSNIDRCSVIDYNGDPNVPALQTYIYYNLININVINFKVLWMLGDELDLTRLTTNDINAMLEVYGVESARATIVSEVKGVFDSYGISVNSHHLSLIADFMTFNGGFRAMNRYGIGSSTSPFLKMSFETATKFLVESCLQGETDYLESPSSRVVVGQVVKVGTGCFDILHNLQVS